MASQRLRITNVDEAIDHLQRIDEAHAGINAALQLEAEDARRTAATDALGRFPVGAARQRRVIDPRHFRVLLQPLRHLQCIAAVPLHAQRQGFQTLQQHEGVEG